MCKVLLSLPLSLSSQIEKDKKHLRDDTPNVDTQITQVHKFDTFDSAAFFTISKTLIPSYTKHTIHLKFCHFNWTVHSSIPLTNFSLLVLFFLSFFLLFLSLKLSHSLTHPTFLMCKYVRWFLDIHVVAWTIKHFHSTNDSVGDIISSFVLCYLQSVHFVGKSCHCLPPFSFLFFFICHRRWYNFLPKRMAFGLLQMPKFTPDDTVGLNLIGVKWKKVIFCASSFN